MNKEQEFRKQTEEAKFEAFSLMCKKVADLEKENAELKEALKGKVCKCMIYFNFKDLEKECAKAKEIIKKLIEAIHIWDCKNLAQVEAEAEQFISEVEK